MGASVCVRGVVVVREIGGCVCVCGGGGYMGVGVKDRLETVIIILVPINVLHVNHFNVTLFILEWVSILYLNNACGLNHVCALLRTRKL